MFEQFAPFEESTLDWLREKLGTYVADAEEVLQIVYIRIWKRNLGAIANPEAYLRKACWNAMREFLRRARRREKHERICRTPAGTMSEMVDVQDHGEEGRLTQGQLRLASLIATGSSVVEAASQLGISPGAARTRLYEARKRLQRRIA